MKQVWLLLSILTLALASETPEIATWTLTSSSESHFSSFLNQTSGPCTSYFIWVNNSIEVTLEDRQQNSTRKMKLIIIPLESPNLDRTLPIKAVINIFFSDLENNQTFGEVIVGNISLIPYEKLTLTSDEASVEVTFAESWSRIIIFVDVFMFGAGSLAFVWLFRIKNNYLGFQLYTFCWRMYLKEVLFGSVNGPNYYFVPSLKGYWLLSHILLVVGDFYGMIRMTPTQTKSNQLTMVAFYCLALLPFDSIGLGIAVCVLFELTYVYRGKRKMSLAVLTLLPLGSIYYTNLGFYLFTSNSYVFFPQGFREETCYALLLITLLEFVSFYWHMKLNPLLLFFSYFYISVVGPYYCIRGKYPFICQICNQKLCDISSLQEKYLIQNGIEMQWQSLTRTPCGHLFHIWCMKQALDNSRLCPIDGGIIENAWIQDNFGDVLAPDPFQAVPAEAIDIPGQAEDPGMPAALGGPVLVQPEMNDQF